MITLDAHTAVGYLSWKRLAERSRGAKTNGAAVNYFGSVLELYAAHK